MSKTMESYSNRLKKISITRECRIELTKKRYFKFYLGRKKMHMNTRYHFTHTWHVKRAGQRYSEIRRSQRKMNCCHKRKLIQSLQLLAPTGCASKLQFSSQMHRGSQEGNTLYIPTIAWVGYSSLCPLRRGEGES